MTASYRGCVIAPESYWSGEEAVTVAIINFIADGMVGILNHDISISIFIILALRVLRSFPLIPSLPLLLPVFLFSSLPS